MVDWDHHTREYIPSDGKEFIEEEWRCGEEDCAYRWTVRLKMSYGSYFYIGDPPEKCPECGSENITVF